MNGSKTVLLIAILLMALLPWGLIFYIANDPDGAGLIDNGTNQLKTAETEEYRALIQRLEQQISSLEEKSSELKEQLSDALDEAERVPELETALEKERTQKEMALERVAQLSQNYDEALSKVVELSSQVGMQRAVESAAVPEEQSRSPREEPARTAPAPAPSTGGWILPPSN